MRKYLFIAVMLTALPVLNSTGRAQGVDVPSDQFPVVGGKYISTGPAHYTASDFQAEIVEMSLVGDALSDTISPLSSAGGTYHIDSFFDVFTELSVDGGPLICDSFFDVFFDIVVTLPETTTGTFQAEIVSMSLSGEIGGTSYLVRESPTLPSTGATTITDIGGGLYHIDSFFDVFTELSVDGGETWIAADGPMRVILPEPTTICLLGFGALALLRKRKV